MTKTITVQLAAGPYVAPVAWQGHHLSVHRPVRSRDGQPALSTEKRVWTISHNATGYAAATSLDVAQRDAIALAKLWDKAFAAVTAAGDAKTWHWAKRWAGDVDRIRRGRPVIGPRDLSPTEQLDSAGTYAEVETAVRRAMGYEPLEDSEAVEQFPADITKKTDGAGAVRRNAETGLLELLWLPRGGNYGLHDACELRGWYEVPAAGDVESWCLGSVAETPVGDSVEPDHPDAWPRLLGLI
jgi:hypothetical protein